MDFETFTGGFVETNGYVMKSGDEVIVVDAPKGIADYLVGKGLKPTRLLLTHQHFDHVEDALAVQQAGARVYAHSAYSNDLNRAELARQSWGLPIEVPEFKVDELLKEGDELNFGELYFEILHVPGHSPDSLCYYDKKNAHLLAGDTLFRRGIGRTDLPGHGDEELLLTGIAQKILTLAELTQVWPGHGGPTTSGEEKQLNPYMA